MTSFALKYSVAQNEHQQKTQSVKRAILLALLLAGTRLFALRVGNPIGFWYAWAALVVLISFIQPVFGSALILGNVMVSIGDETPWGLSVGHLAGGAAIIRLILDMAVQKVSLKGAFRKSHLAFMAIIAIVLLGSTIAFSPSAAYNALFKLLLIYMLYLILYAYVKKPEQLLFLSVVVVLSAGFSALWAVKDITAVSSNFRAEGLLGTSNYMAIYSAVAIPLTLGLYLYSKPKMISRLFLILIPIFILAIIASASRGGALVVLVAAGFSILLWGGKNRGWILILLIVLAAVIGFNLNRFSFYRYSNTIDAVRLGTITETSRIKLAQYSLEIWKMHPLIGIGARNWLYGFNEELGKTAFGSPHVVPTTILAEMGMLGAVAYVVFILLCIRDYAAAIRNFKAKDSNILFLAQGWFIAAIAMSFAWTSGNPYNQFWFLLLMMGGIFQHVYFSPDLPYK